MKLQLSGVIKSNSTIKLFYIFANVAFLVSAFFAIYYYKERCLYIDNAFQLFKIITFENFNFEAFRYGVFLTQILPIIAIKLGLSLKLVLVIFSLSFVVVNYLIFLICYHVLREKTVVFIIPSILLMGISHGFFYTVTEIYQALIFVVLFYAWINTRFKQNLTPSQKVIYLSIAFCISLLCFFTHPLSVFAIVFLLLYYALDKQYKWNRETLLLIPLILIVAIVKVLITKTDSYEGNLLSTFTSLPTAIASGVFKIENLPIKFLIFNVWGVYFIPLILFAGLNTSFVYNRKYNLLAFYCLTLSVIICVFTLTFKNEDNIIMEKNYSLLMLLIAIPFSQEVLFSNSRYKLYRIIGFLLVIISGFCFISNAGKLYQRRTAYLHSLNHSLENKKSSKFLINKEELNAIVGIPWAFSIETLLYSAIETPQNQKTIYISSTPDEFEEKEINDTSKFLMTPFFHSWDIPLNKKYFNLSNCTYKWLSKEDLYKHRKFHDIALFDFNTMENAIILPENLQDTTSVSNKGYSLDKETEFGLTYKTEINKITLSKNPVIVLSTKVLTPEHLEPESVFIVVSVENDSKSVYYHTIDVGKSVEKGRWTPISQLFDFIPDNSSDILKIYFWNPQQKQIYINKLKISVYE